MGEARRKAAAFAAELASAYPSQVSRETLSAYTEAFTDCLNVADDVCSLLRVRSSYPPSVAMIYEAAREVRKETKSPSVDPALCVFADGIACFNCVPEGEPGVVHGHLMDAGQGFHGAFHLSRHREGEPGHYEAALHPERCDCGFDVPPDANWERVVGLLGQTVLQKR